MPEALDFASVLQLAHTTLLRIHLLETLVLCKLLHQLLFEFVFHAALFCSTLGLQAHLEIFCLLQLLLVTFALFSLSSFLGHGCLFAFLEIKFIAKIFLEFLFSSALHLFSFQFFENGVTGFFSSVLGSLDLVKAILLLFSVLADHFVFVSLHFLLASLECSLFVDREDHVGLSLLHLKSSNAGHFAIFINHALDYIVNLILFLFVLFVSLAFQLF